MTKSKRVYKSVFEECETVIALIGEIHYQSDTVVANGVCLGAGLSKEEQTQIHWDVSNIKHYKSVKPAYNVCI